MQRNLVLESETRCSLQGTFLCNIGPDPDPDPDSDPDPDPDREDL